MPQYAEILLFLVVSPITGLLTAIVTGYYARPKTSAEAEKLKAEAAQIVAQANAETAQAFAQLTTTLQDANKDRDTLRDAMELRDHEHTQQRRELLIRIEALEDQNRKDRAAIIRLETEIGAEKTARQTAERKIQEMQASLDERQGRIQILQQQLEETRQQRDQTINSLKDRLEALEAAAR
jgi:hypothetical protein